MAARASRGEGWRRRGRLEEEAGGGEGVSRRKLEAARAAEVGSATAWRGVDGTAAEHGLICKQPLTCISTPLPQYPRPFARARGQVWWLEVTALQVMK